jgi:hypothetical protein
MLGAALAMPAITAITCLSLVRSRRHQPQLPGRITSPVVT